MRKKVIFWIVWLLLVPFVFLIYLATDIYRLRKSPTCFLKTRMVFDTVYGKMILQKP